MGERSQITVRTCGPSRGPCKCRCGIELGEDGKWKCDHNWDGEEEIIDYPSGAQSVSATCSKCGMSAMSHALWTAP